MQRAESCCATVSTETIYASQHYDAPGKFAREVVARRSDLTRAIDYCVWHVRCVVALPNVITAFGTDTQTVQWVMTAYLLYDAFPTEQRGLAMGPFIMVASFGPILGQVALRVALEETDNCRRRRYGSRG